MRDGKRNHVEYVGPIYQVRVEGKILPDVYVRKNAEDKLEFTFPGGGIVVDDTLDVDYWLWFIKQLLKI